MNNDAKVWIFSETMVYNGASIDNTYKVFTNKHDADKELKRVYHWDLEYCINRYGEDEVDAELDTYGAYIECNEREIIYKMDISVHNIN